MFGLFFYLLFKVAAFTLNTLLSGLPLFFGIGALFFGFAYLVDKRVPRGFVQWLGATVRAEPIKGILLGLCTVVFAPFVGMYLLGKALLLKRVREAMGGARERAAEAMRERARATGQGTPIGQQDADFEEVRRDDGLVIRIPKE